MFSLNRYCQSVFQDGCTKELVSDTSSRVRFLHAESPFWLLWGGSLLRAETGMRRCREWWGEEGGEIGEVIQDELSGQNWGWLQGWEDDAAEHLWHYVCGFFYRQGGQFSPSLTVPCNSVRTLTTCNWCQNSQVKGSAPQDCSHFGCQYSLTRKLDVSTIHPSPFTSYMLLK